MNIGQAAAASGVSAKMIRHYESIGVLPPPPRSLSGYRRYGEADVQRLSFIRRARAAGFGTAQIKALMSLWQDRQRPAREVKRLVQGHLAEIEERIAELTRIAAALSHLTARCHGDDRPECPILDSLSQDESAGKPGPAPGPGRRRVPAPRGSSRAGRAANA